MNDNNKHIGTVISTDRTPNSSEFCFVTEGLVKKGQYISVKNNEGTVVARVSDIIRTNKYFERAESVKEFERSGKPVEEMFPSNRWEFSIAEAVCLGVYSDNNLARNSVPVSPGTKVYLSSAKTLSRFFGFDSEKGMFLGNIEHHNVPVKINMTRLLQKHFAILAMSGSGKSYLMSILLEELLLRDNKHGQVAVIVIDTHGEYVGFAEDEKYMKKTNVILGGDFRIGVPGLSTSMVTEFMSSLSGVQKRELRKLFSLAKKKFNGSYELKDVIALLEESEIKTATKEILQTLLINLNSTKLFAGYDNPPMEKLAKQGYMTVIDISDMTSQREKQMVVTYVAKKLFDARRKGIIPPFLLVLEEAHNFVPETAKQERAISRHIIEKIAREGRKFHAALCLISQRPINLSTTILSQCNTDIILRVTNPYDLKHIGETSEGITSDVLKTISSLRVGEALIVGEAVNYPLFVKIRNRSSKSSEKGIPLEEAALRFASNKEQKKEDIKSFM